MRFIQTRLPGAFVIELEPYEDERGVFARTFCEREFAAHGLATRYVQCSTSMSRLRGTLRGLHFQRPPGAENKLVRCIAGAVHDVIVDLRPDSPTHLQHVAVELTAASRRQIYVPRGFAHGFQVLEGNSEVFYQIDAFYAAEHASGVRHDDPSLGIAWPLPVAMISERDRSWPWLNGGAR